MSRIKFSPEFKIESASLVLDKDYNIAGACRAVGETELERWITQLEQERQGKTFIASKDLTSDQQKNQELENKIKRIEREKYIGYYRFLSTLENRCLA